MASAPEGFDTDIILLQGLYFLLLGNYADINKPVLPFVVGAQGAFTDPLYTAVKEAQTAFRRKENGRTSLRKSGLLILTPCLDVVNRPQDLLNPHRLLHGLLYLIQAAVGERRLVQGSLIDTRGIYSLHGLLE